MYTGAMRNVMWKGELGGTLSLDTLADKKHLYGLGPMENLVGEILIADGKSYTSTVLNDSLMQVNESFSVRAPFFVYAQVDEWVEQPLPDSVQNLRQLNEFLTKQFSHIKSPFAFKLTGQIEKAFIHIVNLPNGTSVRSPQDAHQGRKTFVLHNTDGEMIGFFSTSHKGIFTHHDSNIHAHLITADKTSMGHLDEVNFIAGAMQLYVGVR
jgi:acetolactate decarboxylase